MIRKFTGKKILALVLSLMMTVCMVPVMSLTANATAVNPDYGSSDMESVPSAYIVTFAGNGKTKDVEVTSFPRTFMADWWNENGELDKIVTELYNFSGYCRSVVPTSSDTAKVTGGLTESNNQYITINSAFIDSVTVDYLYYNL